MLTATVPAGYFLTFDRELGSCPISSYSSGQVQAVYIIGLILVFVALGVWVLFMGHLFGRVNSEEKYREVNTNTNQTEQVEEVKEVKRGEEYRKNREQPYTYEKRME